MDIDAQAVHGRTERSIRFGFQPMEEAPADVQAVQAICRQRTVGVNFGNGGFVKELGEVRGGHGWLSFAACIPAAVRLQRHLRTALHEAERGATIT